MFNTSPLFYAVGVSGYFQMRLQNYYNFLIYAKKNEKKRAAHEYAAQKCYNKFAKYRILFYL
jgi:hypothetical protein